MKWIEIPDHWVMEANGFSWREGGDDNESGGAARHFRVRYAYSMIYKNLFVDIIEDREDGTSDIIMKNGIHEDAETFHLAVAAFERTFAGCDMVKTGQFAQLAALLDLYKQDLSAITADYIETQKEKINDGLSLLFSAYQFAKAQNQAATPQPRADFDKVVYVDFRGGKKAYKPSHDLLEQVRGAIEGLSANDNPIIHGTGRTPTPNP